MTDALVTDVDVIVAGMSWAEGPLWIPRTGRLRWSDLQADRILEWEPSSGAVTVQAEGAAADFPNGRCLDVRGDIVQCSQGGRRLDRDSGDLVSPLATHYGTARLNSPNDVALAPDGAVWFTDPSYGIGDDPRDGHPGREEYGGRHVFRLPPEGNGPHPMIRDLDQPNGLGFSPDGGTVYVSDTGTGQGAIFAWDLVDGTCASRREFARPPVGAVDGFCVDMDGRVWASCGDGIVVFDPHGAEIGRIRLGEITTNCAFGGPDGSDLYVTGERSVFRLRTLSRAPSSPHTSHDRQGETS